MLGQTIGSYKILHVLGEGGMGTVYLGQHQVIGRLAAIKLLLPVFSADEEIVGRLFNEARMTALIRHPGLVDIYDFGRLASGSAYVVMEYLEGETLAALLQRSRLLPPELARALAIQVAAAVGAAHAKGIVHRDLKPENIFIVADEDMDVGLRARVLDFGIAKLSAELTGGIMRTRTGSMLGTPLYMSPEQCRGAGTVDSRTDIYSLGCILFEMLTGRRLFAFEGMGEIIAAHLYGTPPVASQVEPTVPAWLDSVLQKLLAKDPAARYPSMDEVAVALGRKPRQRASLTSGAADAAGAQPTPTTLGRTAGERGSASVVSSRGPRSIALVLAGVVVLAGLGLVIALRGGEPAPVAARLQSPEPQAPARPTLEPPRPVAPLPDPPARSPVEVEADAPPPPVEAKADPPPAATVESPARKVLLKIRSAPEGAEVFLADGQKIGVTPVEYTTAAAAGSVTFELKLAGHASKRVTMPSDVDGERSVRLPTAASRGKRPKDTVDPFEE